MLRRILSAVSVSTIVPSLALPIVLSAAAVAHARSTVVTHNIDVDSVATCGVIASKQKNWTLTDAIKTKSGARCFFVEVVEIKSRQKWMPSQPIGSATWSMGAGRR